MAQEKLKLLINGEPREIEVLRRTHRDVLFRVEGRQYCVEVASEVVSSALTPADAKVRSPKVSSADEAAPSERKSVRGNTSQILSPMFGTITAILVEPGQKVSKGDVLLRIEAMKMENNISATATGTVVTIHVSSGQEVKEGAPLIDIK